MPGTALVTLGPDLSFAAASIFITSSNPKSFQESAGSALVMIQNIAAAIMTAVGDSIGQRHGSAAGYDFDLEGVRAMWWFSLGISLLGALICAVFVRIPRSEEKDHVLLTVRQECIIVSIDAECSNVHIHYPPMSSRSLGSAYVNKTLALNSTPAFLICYRALRRGVIKAPASNPSRWSIIRGGAETRNRR
jgi:MFS family permease